MRHHLLHRAAYVHMPPFGGNPANFPGQSVQHPGGGFISEHGISIYPFPGQTVIDIAHPLSPYGNGGYDAFGYPSPTPWHPSNSVIPSPAEADAAVDELEHDAERDVEKRAEEEKKIEALTKEVATLKEKNDSWRPKEVESEGGERGDSPSAQFAKILEAMEAAKTKKEQ
eukprot:PLAT8070.2.p3 GENE.PLAT8070.2~~PLAT8070.2.p3  ORF type:complete len:170 (+),score=61.03 PLAT8070.2:350-859(+)